MLAYNPASGWEPRTYSAHAHEAPSSTRWRAALAQRPQGLNKMKSLVSQAGGQAPSNGIRSHSQGCAQGAQKSPLALILESQLQRADREPRFHLSDTRFLVLRRRQYTCTASVYNALLRDGIDLGRVTYTCKLIKHCIMEPYRNAVEKQINTSAAGAAMVPLPWSNRLVTSNYKPRKPLTLSQLIVLEA